MQRSRIRLSLFTWRASFSITFGLSFFISHYVRALAMKCTPAYTDLLPFSLHTVSVYAICFQQLFTVLFSLFSVFIFIFILPKHALLKPCRTYINNENENHYTCNSSAVPSLHTSTTTTTTTCNMYLLDDKTTTNDRATATMTATTFGSTNGVPSTRTKKTREKTL